MTKITVVDDSVPACRALAKLLGRHGHQAECISDSQTAMAHLNVEVPDLVILDVMMPAVDGIELLKQIKQSIFLHETKVVMYSAIADEATVAQAIRLGALAFLQKGGPWDEFYAQIAPYLMPDKTPNGSSSLHDALPAGVFPASFRTA